MIKKNMFFISLYFISIFFLFIGCSSSGMNNNINESIEAKIVEPPITQKEFYDAFTLLNDKLTEEQKINSLNVQKELFETGPILSLYMDGDDQYIISWIDGGKILIFFKTENSKIKPLYMNVAPIKAVKLLGECPEGGIRLVEVTSYGASASYQRENVEVFAINGDNVTSVWDYDTMKAYSHPVEGKKLFEFVIETSSFRYSPWYQTKPGYDEKDIMRIIVNETKEVIHTSSGDLNKVVSTNKTNSQKTFVWDNSQLKFIEKT
ncbi:hypothetical protein V6C42_01970 [Pseudoclostridium thermosuccinogenes]|uniref:hypothetical protein n=1 Tax=Clostridium thermosuccinogenes TaxID=84032 RepID=UPI002FD9ED2F